MRKKKAPFSGGFKKARYAFIAITLFACCLPSPPSLAQADARFVARQGMIG